MKSIKIQLRVVLISVFVVVSYLEVSASENTQENKIATYESKNIVAEFSDEWFLKKALAFRATPSSDERLKIIAEMEGLSGECRNLETKAKLFYHLGSFYYAMGDSIQDPADILKLKEFFQQSEKAFNQALELRPNSETVILGALRQLAQLNASPILNNPQLAVMYYDELERILNSNTNSLNSATKEMYLRDLYSKLPNLKDKIGEHEAAMVTRSKAISILPEPTTPMQVLEKARQLDKIGEKEKAQEYYYKLFNDYPNFQRDSGDVIYLMMEQASAAKGIVSTNKVSEEDMMFAIWNDPRNQHFPQIYSLGHNLAYSLYNAGDKRFSVFSIEMKSRIAESLRTNSTDNINRYKLRLYQEQLLYLLAREAYGNADLEKTRLEEYINTCPDGGNFRGIMERYIELGKAEIDNEQLLTQKWKSLFFVFFILVVVFVPFFFLSRKRV